MTDIPQKLFDPCDADPHGDPVLYLEDAVARMLAEIRPVSGNETVTLQCALGRILAEDVQSSISVPSNTNSAMDGYALRAADLPATGAAKLKMVGTAWAGRPFQGQVGPGECARIMTGAPVPTGADTVVMQEHVSRQDDRVRVGPGHRPGQHVRQAGEDIRAGDVALAAGVTLRPAHLGLLASIGAKSITVRRRPRVAFFSTGDEIRTVGERLGTGQIYDSNRHTIGAMLTRLDVDPVDMGVIPDDRAAIEQAFATASADADAVVTSGGVSVGEADYVGETLEKLGRVGFWKVAIKPGRPIAFGRVGDAVFFGLPGNPVSVMATFYHLVRPALLKLKGVETPDPDVMVRAVCQSRLRKKPGRIEFQRGVLTRDEYGRYLVATTGHQGAGVLRSMAEANCFIVLPRDGESVSPGDEVDVEPFSALV